MNWEHLIEAARLLAGIAEESTRQGRPRQAMLKRAVSTAYYAMFHALCFSNANTIAGTLSNLNRPAWLRVYRALEHGAARTRMVQSRVNLPTGARNFATSFAALQEQRQLGDYDFSSRFLRRDVIRLIDRAENAIRVLYATGIAERRTLATLVLLRGR